VILLKVVQTFHLKSEKCENVPHEFELGAFLRVEVDVESVSRSGCHDTCQSVPLSPIDEFVLLSPNLVTSPPPSEFDLEGRWEMCLELADGWSGFVGR
jgi:hypothetical protein